jgi:hypothetical protein
VASSCAIKVKSCKSYSTAKEIRVKARTPRRLVPIVVFEIPSSILQSRSRTARTISAPSSPSRLLYQSFPSRWRLARDRRCTSVALNPLRVRAC